MADGEITRAEERKAREARHRKLAETIRAGWARTGYRPLAHLSSVSTAGESAVLDGFLDAARLHVRGLGNPLTLAIWLSTQDMIEVRDHARVTLAPGGTPHD